MSQEMQYPVMRTQSPVPGATDQAAIRGITNSAGSNNCFLNCAVQALWNLDPFRASFILLNQHKCSESCIFCSLLSLAANYQYHEEGPVTPDVLRNALAKTYQTENRFQIGFMEDAAECFEGILYNLHISLSDNTADHLCTADKCISHRLFSMTLVEQDKCVCLGSSEPLTFDQYIFYAAVTPLTALHATDQSLTFATLLKQVGASEKQCPDGKCSGPARLVVSMIEKPDVFCVGMAWPNTEVDTALIKKLVDAIEQELDLDELFENVSAPNNNVYRLVGIMVYYGMHYFTFFFHSGIKKWLLYDDASVTEVGPTWEHVKKMLVKGKYQPLVLLYVNSAPEKTLLPTKKSVLSKAYKDLKSHKHKQKHRLACLAPASPVSSKYKLREERTVPRQESEDTLLGSSPSDGMLENKTFLNNVVSGLDEKFSAGLSLIGLKDGDKFHKKKFINDCMKQADGQYFEAKKSLIIKEYGRALDLSIDSCNFYKFILSHEDSSLTQREQAKIKYETARIRSRRISRRIPVAELTDSQLNALYHRCPLCDNYREDEMQFCHACTTYCTTCSKELKLSEREYCAACLPQYVMDSQFEQKLSEHGHSAKEVVWYDTKHASPPPYETLRKTKCIICSRSMVTNNDICHFCTQARGL